MGTSRSVGVIMGDVWVCLVIAERLSVAKFQRWRWLRLRLQGDWNVQEGKRYDADFC